MKRDFISTNVNPNQLPQTDKILCLIILNIFFLNTYLTPVQPVIRITNH